MSAPQEWDERPLRPGLAVAWMLLASTLFAVMNLLAKRAMREAPWHEVAFGRAAFGASIIYLSARSRRVSLAIHDHASLRRRTLAGTIAMATSFLALSRLPLGDAVTISNLTPLLVAIAAQRALGEATSSTLGVSIVLGFTGVATLAGPQLHGLDHHAVGLAAALVSASASAVAMIQLRRLGRRETAEAVSFQFVAWSAVAMLAIGGFSTLSGVSRWVMPSASVAASIAGAGLCGGLAQLTMTKAYAFDKAARVGAVGYVSVVLSQVLGAAFLGDRPTTTQLLGACVVILSGVALVAGGARERRVKAVSPVAESMAQEGESS
ncbi:MAG: DMT family transporter [Polyangiales bacterium]